MTALDHVFVCCEQGAPEAEALVRLGLTEGSGNTHPGQGTANRRFFFENAYLELFWVADPEEARGEVARPTRLFERWSRRHAEACPFGIVLRPEEGEPLQAPFPVRAYRPPYLPPPLSIDIATGTPLGEPGLFFMSFAGSPGRVGKQATTHDNGATRITGVAMGLTGPGPLSRPAAVVEERGLVSFHAADAWILTLTLDDGAAGMRADLRPDLPLALRW